MDRRTARQILARLERDARALAAAFDLRYRALEAERGNVRRRYGVCFSDGTIRIRLRHAVSGRPLKYSSLVNTLCHELAHLRHFDHGLRFRRLYARILAHARREGIYRPARAGVRRTPPVAPTASGGARPVALVASAPAATAPRRPGGWRPGEAGPGAASRGSRGRGGRPPQQLPLFG